MAEELETKLRVDSHEPVRRKLRDLGAEFVREGVETNWIFDRPDGSLRSGGVGLRVRSVAVERGDEASATLTVKGPAQRAAVKRREELETVVDSADTAVAMLEMLGFACVLRYEKRRESWRFKGCHVELDTPPHVGLFVEIEGPDETTITRVQKAIGLGSLTHIRNSYVGLLMSYCNGSGTSKQNLKLC